MRRPLGHRRNECDGGGAAAYYHHSLAFVVEVFRPLLRVHNLPAEPLDAGPLRSVPSLVVVVARAEVEETAGELDDWFSRAFSVSASTVQSASADDQEACLTRWP